MGPTLAFSESIHAEKYRSKGESFKEAMNRVAGALSDNPDHFKAFRDTLLSMRFMPGGRIQSAIGSTKGKAVTAYNCFVAGRIEDSFVDGHGSIMDIAKEAATTMRMGGGIGYDFSTLRPRGATIKKLQSSSSGPVSFMQIYDAICRCIASSGHRRGAQMGVMRVDHPDIEEFVHAKQPPKAAEPIMEQLALAEPGTVVWQQWYTALQAVYQLTGFNISIAVTDEFMLAVKEDKPFTLRFGGKAYREIDAKSLWEMIMRSAWDWAEPGIIFIDTVNKMNNLAYCEEIIATNPCFTGDTKVWTDHGHKRFDSLVGKTVDVLTQTSTGKLVYRTMRNIRKTQRQAGLVQVVLDNGGIVTCTPTHEIFLVGGGSIEAQHLQPGHHISSVYPYRANQKGYLRLTNGKDMPLEHHVPFEGTKGLGQEFHVHHRNGIKRDDHRVVSVKHLDEKEDVYCGTVDETGKFFVATGTNDGILVSNCGEQPLPAHGACLLGSFNLTRYIKDHDGTTFFDYDQFAKDIPHVVRAMDNVTDLASFPLYEQEKMAKATRRMGLGVTGLANALEALGYPYGNAGFVLATEQILKTLAQEAYRASALLAEEKGAFPRYDKSKYLAAPFIQGLDQETRSLIARHGIRNSHLTSIAPTGTISLCADNISSGIEPVFAYSQRRTVKMPEGDVEANYEDYGVRVFSTKGKRAQDVTVVEHLAVLAAASSCVDSAVSKTCNVPVDTPWIDFKNLYMRAWELGCKGLATYQVGGKRAGIIKSTDEDASSCRLDLETGRKECE
ncbi:hypothetical protein LCGC14_0599660 [marine sediment metagenome]|uniref:ribonucleoside-diphosphate reductase n=1 Tax=marine sediment metagenome TaxID=412755 RepID=A0A0F9TX41_9ZZZZ